MRTSTAWVLAAALVLLAALATYDLALRQAYQRQASAADPNAYVQLGFRNFSEVVLPDSGGLNVKIRRGPFQVKVLAPYASRLHLRQQGRQLLVAVDSAGASDGEEQLVISCPRLTSVITRRVGPVPTARAHYEVLSSIAVTDFQGDSLALYQAEASQISLSNNRWAFLQATVGTGLTSHATLTLDYDNHIAAADLTVNGHGELTVNHFIIPRLRYRFADSAVVQLLGGMLRPSTKSSRAGVR